MLPVSAKVCLVHAGNELVRLELSDNPMTSDVAGELASTIRRHPKLKSLILNDISLCGDGSVDGLLDICSALNESAPELEELELSLNEITEEGGKVISRDCPLLFVSRFLN